MQRQRIVASLGAALRVALATLGLAVGLACESQPWDAASLEARHPELRAHQGHRLADLRPYYWPHRDRLTLFLCRWPDGAQIPVAIDAEATPLEREKLRRALAAWEGAGLGVGFTEVDGISGVGIEIDLVDGMLSWSSSTVAECALSATGATSERVPARMLRASIQLGRQDPRFVGSALHELAHALGFQGHPRRGASILVRDAKQLLAASVSVGKGEAFSDPSLSALYALPIGTVLAELPLPPGHSAAVDQLVRRASREGWFGPLLQVGDRVGRVSWIALDGSSHRLRLRGLLGALDAPERLVIEPLP